MNIEQCLIGSPHRFVNVSPRRQCDVVHSEKVRSPGAGADLEVLTVHQFVTWVKSKCEKKLLYIELN